MKKRTIIFPILFSAIPSFVAAQESVPVNLGVAAPTMLNRDHNGGCGIEKDTRFKAQLDFVSASGVGGDRPWEAIDFATDPEAYMKAVVQVALADNDGINWDDPARIYVGKPGSSGTSRRH